jgi:hypothetical protein
MSPRIKVLLEKLIASQLAKILPVFYGTQRFITVFTNAPLNVVLKSNFLNIPFFIIPSFTLKSGS